MLEIKSLASGSSGNCYWVSDDLTPLLLECGVPYGKIQRAIDFEISKLGGCLVSHEHGDHSASVKDLTRSGVECYMSSGTNKALNFDNKHRIQVVKPDYRYEIGSWFLKVFKTQHDAADPVGFLLYSKSTKDKLVYITDSYYSRYTFYQPTYIMVECNFSLKILDENIKSGSVHPKQKARLLKSHFSLENVKDFLLANDLSRLEEVWLLHLSSRNSNQDLFKREIQKITGKPVYIA